MACSPAERRPFGVGGQADEHEPVAHGGDHLWAASHAVVQAPMTTSRPFHVERAAAVGADVAGPVAVVDLPQRGEHQGAGVPVHRQDRGEVLDHERAGLSPTWREQAAGRVLGPGLGRGAGQQRGLAGDGGDDVRPGAGERRHRLGLGSAADPPTTSTQGGSPDEFLGRGGAQHDVERVEVVVVAEPLQVGVTDG